MLNILKLLPLLLTVASAAQRTLDLGNIPWTVSNNNNVTIRTRFPSQVHLDLHREGVIEDPIFGFNDVNQLWVTRSNWTYTSAPLRSL